MGFYKLLGLCFVIEAEIYAIMLGLQMRLQIVILYSDCLDAISILIRDSPNDHPLKDIIGKTRDLLFRDWEVEHHHTPRDNISCAGFMGKEGHSVVVSAEVTMIPTVPKGWLDMVLKDQCSRHSQFSYILLYFRLESYNLVPVFFKLRLACIIQKKEKEKNFAITYVNMLLKC